MRELNVLKKVLEKYNEIVTMYEDLETLIELGLEENDESLLVEIEESLDVFGETRGLKDEHSSI